MPQQQNVFTNLCPVDGSQIIWSPDTSAVWSDGNLHFQGACILAQHVFLQSVASVTAIVNDPKDTNEPEDLQETSGGQSEEVVVDPQY